MLCPHFGQIANSSFFCIFGIRRWGRNKHSYSHWTGCPCSARKTRFHKPCSPTCHSPAEANTQVLNPRQRNQQFLLANEPWHLWATWALWPILVELGRCTFAETVGWGWRLKDQLSSHQTNLGWALPRTSISFTQKGEHRKWILTLVHIRTILRSHGGSLGRSGKFTSPCMSFYPVFLSSHGTEFVLFRWFIYFRFQIIRTVVGCMNYCS